MAVELKKFQAEFAAIDNALKNACGERKVLGDSEGNTKKLLDGAKLGIGDRAQELKAKGSQAKTLQEFAADAEIKKGLEVVTQALNNFKGIEARKNKNYDDFKKIYNSLLDLGRRMDAEIADRKKKLFEPKSLPDMVKLADQVHKILDEQGDLKGESIKTIALGKPPKAGVMESTYKAAIEQEIKKSAAIRANAAEGELVQKFTPRLMKLRWDKANGLGKEVETLCAAAVTAKKAGKAKEAKEKVTLAITKVTEMNTIVTDYSTAYNKNKTFLEQNPEHGTIFKMVSGLTSLSNRLLKTVQAAQSAVG